MWTNRIRFASLGLLLAICTLGRTTEAGLIKDLFQRVTHTNNRTEKAVQESVPICGSGVFSTPDEASLSPELIFISTRPSRVREVRQANDRRDRNKQSGSGDGESTSNERASEPVGEISREFRFHAENVTIEELERYGFNPDAPVSFLVHGFTSGYPLQAWISAIVEAYTIDRETNNSGHSSSLADSSSHNHGPNHEHYSDREPPRETYENVNDNYSPDYQRSSNKHDRRATNYNSSSERVRRPSSMQHEKPSSSLSGRNSKSNPESVAERAAHNLFIVNWNYAARGILYPRAVANIPIVASHVTRFINDKLIGQAQVDPNRIQIIGHSLGAHLAGFIGKNTKSKLARIYGLDPAGPCFGTISGPLYPSSKRLAPTDAHEVITIQTNSALLGIEKPLGKYSVFVEGGANQPGCKPSGVLKSIGTLTWDGGDFDTVACSHSRAPNLLTYRHDQSDSEGGCQMVAYACKDWQSFLDGHCGVCDDRARAHDQPRQRSSQLEPVQCYRIGLDWQYPTSGNSLRRPKSNSSYRPSSQNPRENASDKEEQYENHHSAPQHHYAGHSSSSIIHDQQNKPNGYYSSTRRPSSPTSHGNQNHFAESGESNGHQEVGQSSSASDLSDRERRDAGNSSANVEERRSREDEVEPIRMFLRTGDTQPYCAFHYQIVLELNESFGRRKPPMSIILQDSEPNNRRGHEQNSLSSDEFGNKFNDNTYTHLLTSNKRLGRIDHAVMIFRDGLQDGHRRLKMIHVNYMSNADQKVRERLSSRLCPVKTEEDRSQPRDSANNRFYFKPCGQNQGHYSSPQDSSHGSNDTHNSSFGQNNHHNPQHESNYPNLNNQQAIDNSNFGSNQNSHEQYGRDKHNKHNN